MDFESTNFLVRMPGSQSREKPLVFLAGWARILLLASIATLPSLACAASYTWVPDTSGTWNDANWGGVAPTSSDDAFIKNSGTALLPAGVSGSYDNLGVSNSTTSNGGAVNVSGGLLTGSSATIGQDAGSHGTATVSGGTWTNSILYIGYYGTGAMTIDGGSVVDDYSYVGGAGVGTVTMTSGTWSNANGLHVGYFGTGAFIINGGYVSSNGSSIGSYNGPGTAIINSGTWSSSDLSVGDVGTGSLAIHGGYVSDDTGYIGSGGPDSNGSATVSGGTWKNNTYLFIGYSGTGSLTISGGSVSDQNAYIGRNAGTSGTVTVAGGTWANDQSLFIGYAGENSSLIVGRDGLVTVNGSLSIDPSHTGSDFLRLNGGYLAWLGDNTGGVMSLLDDGLIQLWNGSEWITATEINGFDFGYFATDEAAYDFSGHEGLGGYTIMTASLAVPEPCTLALLGMGGACLLFIHRRFLKTGKLIPTP